MRKIVSIFLIFSLFLSVCCESALAAQQCKECGSQIEAGDKFCSNCGATVSSSASTPAPAKKIFHKSDYSSVTGKQLARTPDNYYEKKVSFSATVFQVIYESAIGYNEYLVEDDDGEIIYVIIDGADINSRILEDDHITIFGVGNKLYTYETRGGSTKTVPYILADKIELLNVVELYKDYISRTYGFDVSNNTTTQKASHEFGYYIETFSKEEQQLVAKEWLKYSDHDSYFYEKQKEFTIKAGSNEKLEVVRDEKGYSFYYGDANCCWFASQKEGDIDISVSWAGHTAVVEVCAYKTGTILFEATANGMVCRFVVHVV